MLSLRAGSLVNLIAAAERRLGMYKEKCWITGRARTLAASLVVGRAGYSQLEEVLHTEGLTHKEAQALEDSIVSKRTGDRILGESEAAYCY